MIPIIHLLDEDGGTPPAPEPEPEPEPNAGTELLFGPSPRSPVLGNMAAYGVIDWN